MRLFLECRSCLEGLVGRTAERLKTSPEVREKAKRLALDYLEQNFRPGEVIPVVLARQLQEILKETAGDVDPFIADKEKEMALARRLASGLAPQSDSLEELIAFSALGNALDFFKTEEEILADMERGVEFTIDDRARFLSRLGRGTKILFLADNSGEAFFDLPLVTLLDEMGEVVYAVKGGAVQNDLTMEDVRRAGLDSQIKRVISTGMASPGLELSLASKEFLQEFRSAHLIIAKGMGHYETLSEMGLGEKVFYILKAKCLPVARSLGVPLGSYVARLGT